MMNYTLLLEKCGLLSLFCTAFFFTACEQADNPSFFIPVQENAYQASLDTATHQRLALTLNNIDQPERYLVQLLQDNGRNQAPEFWKATEEGYTWYFQPINNPCLYHFIGKEGQMPNRFSFLIGAAEVQDTLSFTIHPALKDSLEEIRQKRQIHLYLPEQGFQQSFHAEANHYLKQLKLDLPDSNVHWTEQELLIGGANLRYAIFEEQDTLQLHYQLINRGSLPLVVSEKPFHFRNLKPDGSEAGDENLKAVLPGERISGKQNWTGQNFPGELYLLADGIRLTEPDTMLIGVPLHLIRRPETALNCRY